MIGSPYHKQILTFVIPQHTGKPPFSKILRASIVQTHTRLSW